MSGPIIATGGEPIAADGVSFSVHEWQGSGPPELHVHHHDDEAWHVLSGSLRIRFSDRTVDAPAGSTVFVPAGTPHTFEADDDARYLIILTPQLRALIDEFHSTPPEERRRVYEHHDSEVVE